MRDLFTKMDVGRYINYNNLEFRSLMSKQAATLLLGLLAMAEGRSDDRNMLREADREDVLHQVETQTLDRIAHRLYADDHE